MNDDTSEAKYAMIEEDLELEGDIAFEDDGSRQSLRTVIREIFFRLPDDVYQELMHGEDRAPIAFFGCGAGQLGQALRWRIPVFPSALHHEHGLEFIEREIVLLSGELCTQPLAEAMLTGAHELAHLFLKHHLIHSSSSGNWQQEAEARERAADGLVCSWGFERPA